MKGDDLRCKKCGNLQTYSRKNTKERVCKICGHVEEIKEIIEEDKDDS